ncbi:MAG: alpha-L-fucosidase [Prolixibacteraceae bacterium]|nr:alpha-L-fucosidase [Prolixibacteraceae bacterium]
MKKQLILILLVCIVLTSFLFIKDQTCVELKSEWSKMNAQKEESREWFTNAKYGMFIHWGIYSIPAGVWSGKTMEEMGRPRVAEWVQYVAKIPRAEYARLANEFNPVNFDAGSVVQLAKDAGMKYLVITTKHHDGFAMYDSDVSNFNIVDATPFKRDIVKELYDECQKHGIEFGIYYSHNIDWYDGGDCQYSVIKEMNSVNGLETPVFGPNLWDPSPNSFDEYLKTKAYPQVTELLKKFPDTKLLWYDMSRYMLPEQSFEFYRLATSIRSQILVNERVGNGFGDYAIPGDNKIPANPDSILIPWETVGTLNNSWGYKSYDNDWKSAKETLFWLVEIVSKGGNYMLNIGPKANGEVPRESISTLREIGKWLELNGEAIYGTKRWKINHDGPTKIHMEGTSSREKKGFKAEFSPDDFWFTAKGNKIYAIALEIPGHRKAVLRSMNNSNIGKIEQVNILGSNKKTSWRQTSEGLEVDLPEVLPSTLGYVIEVEERK